MNNFNNALFFSNFKTIFRSFPIKNYKINLCRSRFFRFFGNISIYIACCCINVNIFVFGNEIEIDILERETANRCFSRVLKFITI